MLRLMILIVVLLAGCTSASYKDAEYSSFLKEADSVTFIAADGTSMIVKGSRSDVQAVADIINQLSP